MELRSKAKGQRETTTKTIAVALAALLSIAAFCGYLRHVDCREAVTVLQLRDRVRANRRDLMVLVPTTMMLQYQAQIVWNHCLSPGRPGMKSVRQLSHSSVLRTLRQEEQFTSAVIKRAGCVDRSRQIWINPDLRREYIRLAAHIRYQAENAAMVLDSVDLSKRGLVMMEGEQL